MRELSAIDALSVYEDALLGAPEGAGALHAVGEDGSRRRLPLGRWLGTPDAAEETVLERAVGPVLDIGCGVGRHVVALRLRGVTRGRRRDLPGRHGDRPRARRRGDPGLGLRASDRPPSGGRSCCSTATSGSAATPTRLLRRSAALLLPGGGVLVELEAPGRAPRAQRVRLEGARVTSSWMPWHFVGYEEIDPLAERRRVRGRPARWRGRRPLVRPPAPRGAFAESRG